MVNFKGIIVQVMMLFGIFVIFGTFCTATSYKPNVIIITADDIGYNDLEKGSLWTKYMDEMSRYSIRLKEYYVMPNGHSTRSALLTGKHPAVLGTQFEINDATKRYGLGTEHQILPQYLKKLGYSTHAVGQWDLGFYSEDMLPTNRGYDSFYGSYLTHGDYNNHTAKDAEGNEGLDLHDGVSLVTTEEFSFKTELYGTKAENIIYGHKKSAENPLHLYVAFQGAQVRNQKDLCKPSNSGGRIPNEYFRRIGSETDPTRKCYKALIKAVDQQLGRILEALKQKAMFTNSIIIFTTTSGGAAAGRYFNGASNSPFRGSKQTVWEGGVRGIALVYSSQSENSASESDCLFHVTDWLPTILSIYKDATATESRLPATQPLYGVNQFNCVFRGPGYQSVSRHTIIHFLYGQSASIMKHSKFKLILRKDDHIAKMDEWYYGTPPQSHCGREGTECQPRSICLFDLENDPCEMRNLAHSQLLSNEIDNLMLDLRRFNRTVKYSDPLTPDPKGNPANFATSWQPWVESSSGMSTIPMVSTYLIAIAVTTFIANQCCNHS